MEGKENVPWELFPHIRALPSAQEWLQLQANRQLSPRTVEAYGRSLEDLLHFCEQQEPPLNVEAVTKADLGLYVKDLVTRPNPHGQQIIHLHSGSGLSDQTIQLRLLCEGPDLQEAQGNRSQDGKQPPLGLHALQKMRLDVTASLERLMEIFQGPAQAIPFDHLPRIGGQDDRDRREHDPF